MWSTATRQLSFNGSAMVSFQSGSPPLPLKGVLVDVYRFSISADEDIQFERLNQAAARTTVTGDFSFSDLPVSVLVQTVIPGNPPYTPIELTLPSSLSNLVFRISVEADVLTGGTSQGTQFLDVYDEREVVTEDWIASHPERMHVPLTGGPAITVLIPEGEEEAALLVGVSVPTPPGMGFHFLRVGRAIRGEIGELGESRADYVDYVGKPGYMISSNMRTVNVQPSFFDDQVDAPFGGTLQIGGQFGADFLALYLSDTLYYTVSFCEYTGSPSLPFDPAYSTNKTQILAPLFNKKYILPSVAFPHGKWETLNLGPFNGTITAVGTSVQVYKRPAMPNPLTEYWPFWDLMVIWNSTAARSDLPAGQPIVLTLEAYQRTGGSETNPELTKLAMISSVNDHLPLHIDNRRPVHKFASYHPSDPPEIKFRTAYAQFISAAENIGASVPMGICNEMTVSPGDSNGNECILVRYSVEDGAGNPHPHVAEYSLSAQYTPKAVPGAPDSMNIVLKPTFSGTGPLGKSFAPIADSYSPMVPPIMEVDNLPSVIVPQDPDGWPPEPNGDTISPPPCPQYALEVSMGCSVRTVNGWSRLYSRHHVSRHIIVKT